MSCQSHLHHTACPAGTRGLISGVGDLGETGIEVRNFLLSQLPSVFLAAFVRRGGVVLYLLLLARPCWTQLADVIPLLLDKTWEFCPQGLGKLVLGPQTLQCSGPVHVWRAQCLMSRQLAHKDWVKNSCL